MSAFKTIKQQNAERAIEKMFEGLDDPSMKAVFRVMWGLDDESILDEVKRVNEENLRDIQQALTITDAAIPDEGQVIAEERISQPEEAEKK